MRTKPVLLLVIFALAAVTMACGYTITLPGSIVGSGVIVQEARPVSSFSRIDFGGIGNLYVELGDTESLTIEAEDNLLQYLETDVIGDRLEIHITPNKNIQPKEQINYYLTVVSLDSVELSGLGDIQLPTLEATDFTLEISGAGNISIASLEAKSLDVTLSGLGSLRIDGGTVSDQRVEISGSGSYDARDLENQQAAITVSGLGSAVVQVSDSLEADISGSGNVNYYGSPTVTSQISGLGSLNRRGD